MYNCLANIHKHRIGFAQEHLESLIIQRITFYDKSCLSLVECRPAILAKQQTAITGNESKEFQKICADRSPSDSSIVPTILFGQRTYRTTDPQEMQAN